MESVVYEKVNKAPRLTLDLDTLKYAYQPIYDINSGRIFGYEGLMRPAGHTPRK